MARADGKIRRVDNWHCLLKERLDHFQNAAFSWGSKDCIQFVFSCIEAQTKVDVSEGVKKYRSERGALKSILKYGGKALDESFDILAERYGLEPVSQFHAGRGDVVCFYDDSKNLCMGVVDLSGTHALFLSKEDGLIRVPLSSCRRAWRID